MAKTDTLRDKLISDLRDAHAMETQITKALESQIKDTDKHPQIQARIQEHLEETRIHAQRMADCLSAYNEAPSSVKSLGAKAMGNVMGAAGGSRSDALAKTARDDYMTEHLEIATYLLLIAEAQALGDTSTVLAAQSNLRDEMRMADWLEQHMAEAVVFSLQDEGIMIDSSRIADMNSVAQTSLRNARSGLTSGVGAPGTDSLGTQSDRTSSMPPATGLGWNPDRARQSESSLSTSGYETTSGQNTLLPPDDEGYPSSAR